MRSKVNLFIPVEIKKRDFASRSLVAFEAVLNNFNVYIGRKFEIDRLVFQKEPGIYFGLVTTETYAPFYKKLKKYGHYIFVNDEEGLITFSDDMYLNLKVSKNSLKLIDKVFLWSETHKKIFDKKFKFKNKYIISGSPRFDLSKNFLKDIFLDDTKFIKKKYTNYILICCSFSFANYYDKNINYTETLKKQKVIKNKKDLDSFNIYLNLNNEALNHFLEAIKFLSNKFKNYSIIVRPHPSENIEIYKNLSNHYSNVFIENKYSIHSWILNAKCIVHNYCTSSPEALSLNTPRFALRKSFNEKVHKTIPYEISIICEDIETLYKKIDNLISQNIYEADDDQLKINFTKYLYNISDNNYAYKIIVNSFLNFIKKHPVKPKNFYYLIYLKLLSFIKKIIKLFLFKYSKKPIISDYIKHKVNKITKGEVYHFFQIYNSMDKKIDVKFLNFEDKNNIVNIILKKTD